MAGNLNVRWIHGSPDCAATTDPSIQIHAFDHTTFILRQSKCSEPGTAARPGPSFEAPFLYLLVGRTRALLLDTGASRSASRFPLAETVGQLLRAHQQAAGTTDVSLMIAHTHSHGDHTAGDVQFHSSGTTVIVPPSLSHVKSFFHLPNWPDGAATVDLVDRVLDIIPIPGHEDSHIAIYDRATQLLLTGDTLYPGLLVVNDWNAYVRSVARLAAFFSVRPVSFILGAHVEMTDQAGRWFGLGALFQPGEHMLQLEKHHLTELHDALQRIGTRPRTDRHADFIIWPSTDPLPDLRG